MVKFVRHPGPFDTLASKDIDDVVDSPPFFTVVSANGQFVYIMNRKLQGGLRI